MYVYDRIKLTRNILRKERLIKVLKISKFVVDNPINPIFNFPEIYLENFIRTIKEVNEQYIDLTGTV
jgi:hypothetical protein